MIILGNCLLSDELFSEFFTCDLNACRGGCCVEGDAGAPLDEEETVILESISDKFTPFMEHEGISAIDSQGNWVRDEDGDITTPLVEGKQCAYSCFDEKGIAGCAIEKAFEKGLTDFRKPISCHLYPVRIHKYPHYDALNYHRWPLCDPARECGRAGGVRVFRFLREALVRKYGEKWYRELEEYFTQSGLMI